MDILPNKWPEDHKNGFFEISQSAISMGLGFVWPVPFDFVFLSVPAGLLSFLVRLFPIFLFHIMTVRDEKMFLTVSHDLSTDQHKKGIERLSDSTLSDKSPKMKNSNKNSPNGPPRKFLTLCQFPDLPIDFCENWCIERLPFDLEMPEKWLE